MFLTLLRVPINVLKCVKIFLSNKFNINRDSLFMHFSQEQFILSIIVLGIIFILLFKIKSSAPSKIQLKHADRYKNAVIKKEIPSGAENSKLSPIMLDPATQHILQEGIKGQKNLNIMFMYNGHSFDAYEILGLPAGAGLSQIEKAHKELTLKHKGQLPILVGLAYQALKSKLLN